MVGGFSRPRKDKALKVSNGQEVKAGHILVRGIPTYKTGVNVKGLGTLFALCPGEVYFSRKKTRGGKMRTFVNVKPLSPRKKSSA
ncbi:MAG: 50S ribosomal protein L27 [Candidatus Omnitrophica bacterium]|nr:50S ribosomal protein L27 [Candidatus Omnitrophota bacterium]MBL7151329.1 50S ribosomal protein L27 [Candidatus Omnitrophota bacterium]MBL7210345.1 50S ribosomal protein L27 [Candidatus Omnitrophota bacterium]